MLSDISSPLPKEYSLTFLSSSKTGCDNYKPYGELRPSSECNFPCPGDATEFCGAGNRMITYQNTVATPPSPSTCITWRGGFSFGNNVLEAVPKTGGGGVTKLYAIPTNPFTDDVYWTIISVSPTFRHCTTVNGDPIWFWGSDLSSRLRVYGLLQLWAG